MGDHRVHDASRASGDSSGALARMRCVRPGQLAPNDLLDDRPQQEDIEAAMNPRNRLAALLAAGALVMALAAVTSAAAPSFGVLLDKSANPTAVAPGGGTVVYTITVTGTGTGNLQTVTVDDGMP